jgi:hypothetical protein
MLRWCLAMLVIAAVAFTTVLYAEWRLVLRRDAAEAAVHASEAAAEAAEVAAHAPDEADVAELVFRDLLHTARPGDLCFLSIESDRRDPPSDLFRRLADLNLPLQPISAAVLPLEPRKDGCYDRSSGRRDTSFGVATTWVSPTSIRAQAVRWRGSLESATYTYTLHKRGGKWVLADKSLFAVS